MTAALLNTQVSAFRVGERNLGLPLLVQTPQSCRDQCLPALLYFQIREVFFCFFIYLMRHTIPSCLTQRRPKVHLRAATLTKKNTGYCLIYQIKSSSEHVPF